MKRAILCLCLGICCLTAVFLTGCAHECDYGEWQTLTEATCTKDGTEERICLKDPSHRESRPIAALGHDPVSHAGQEATCTEKGWKAYETCTRCDYTTYEEIAALGHDPVSHAGQEATCTEKGWKGYETCTRCDYTTYEDVALT